MDHSKPINADEQRSIERAARGSSEPVRIAGRPIKPGATGAPFAAAGLGTDLPASVLAALIGLGLAMLAGAAFAGQRRWPGGWRTLGASLGDGVRRGISRFRK